MSQENKRKYRRLEVGLPVIVRSSQGRRVNRAENLSFGGMQIGQGVGNVEKGEFIDLKFRIPECPIPIHCEAEVVHRADDKLGVRFTRSFLLEQAAIARHVADGLRG